MVQDHQKFVETGAKTGLLQIQPLTDDQDRFVMNLFQKYVPEELSVEDAAEIITALESAGIRGPDVRASVLTAGLDPQKFIALLSPQAIPPAKKTSSIPSTSADDD